LCLCAIFVPNAEHSPTADTHAPYRDLGCGFVLYTLRIDALEQCLTVTAAITYLQRALRIGGGNLVLADAMGDVVVFERALQVPI